MANFNKVILAGNLTRDPELRYTPKGKALAAFGLAINRSWKDESGQTKEEVTFVDIEAWGRQAEVVGQYFKKGRPILIEGRLRYDTWEDKQTNQKKSKLKVVLESFSFIDSIQRTGDGSPAPMQARQNPAAAPAPEPAPMAPPPDMEAPPSEDDVPF